jgi:hypothetical protein
MPLWLCFGCTAWTVALVPVYWVHLGPANFLWFSDIALFLTIAALWTNSRRLISIAAVSVLLLEIVWNIEFAGHLVGLRITGMTDYMFDSSSPLHVRAMSLFHVWMPVVMLWMIRRVGYERQAVYLQTAICWLVLAVTYAFTDPSRNINWVFRLGGYNLPIPPLAYMAGLMLAMPLLVYHPTHRVLKWWEKATRR